MRAPSAEPGREGSPTSAKVRAARSGHLHRMYESSVRRSLAAAFASLACATCALPAQSDRLDVHPLYGQGAVLQRGVRLVLRGSAGPGDTVVLTSATLPGGEAVAGDDGRFALTVSPQSAGGPHEYLLSAGDDRLAVGDVYVGDVFLASGQSNMQWTVADTDDAARAATVDDPLLRHLAVPNRPTERPALDLPPGVAWQASSPDNTPAFSAVGFYFAEALRTRDPSVAIGIVNASWGGSRIEAWLPGEIAGAVGTLEVPAEVRSNWERLLARYPEAFTEEGNDEDFRGTGGTPTAVGKKWEWAGYDGIDGEIYFDRELSLSAEQAARPATLVLGAVDDSDSTWVNGALVGSTYDAYAKTRRYELPSGTLTAGDNRITVWVEDTRGGGGLYQSPDSIYLLAGGERVSLGEGWTSRPRRLVLDSLRQPQQQPALLYNGMLHPLSDVKAAGALWYQGESNAGDLAEAEAYGGQLRELVAVLRDLTQQPELPVLVVELPEWREASDEAYEGAATWPEIRRQQASIDSDPYATSVVTLGYGDEEDIHPRNKRPVGERLAEAARRLVYGESDAPRQARPADLEPTGQAVNVRFEGVGDGLSVAGGGPVRTLAVRDADGRWHAATGQIVGVDRVRVVPPDGVAEVEAVAYAWANTPRGANLVNGYGYPVSSFRLEVARN